jgi:3-oxoacyl-[acyl-carrier protein] reductase
MAKPYALVTGASGGIGSAVAEALAERGFNLVLNCRQTDNRAEAVKHAVEAHGREARLVPFDVTDRSAVESALRPLLKEGVDIGVLVNNAGVVRDALLLDQLEDDWAVTVRTTLDGFFNVTKAVLLPMVRRRQGRIINVSSIVGLVGNSGQVSYAAGRAGLIGATRSLSREVASHGITVNAVAPGLIDTPMTHSLADIGHLSPVGRPGTPREVASLIAFLASEEAAYITGQVITIDGGLT